MYGWEFGVRYGECGGGGVVVWCKGEELVWSDEECDGALRGAVPGR